LRTLRTLRTLRSRRSARRSGRPQTAAIEVDYADGALGVEQYIVRIEIGVIDARTMQPRNCGADGAPRRFL
jgi:hypothetical protein